MVPRHCGVTLSPLSHSPIVTHEFPRTIFSSYAEGAPGCRTCTAIEADPQVPGILRALGRGEIPWPHMGNSK